MGMENRVKPDSCELCGWKATKSLAEATGHDERHGEEHPQGVLHGRQGGRRVGVEGPATERRPEGLQGLWRAIARCVGVDRLRQALKGLWESHQEAQ